ncbi:MAG: hypothetical protein J6X35_04940 [Bacteroidales bacterium]|nr:hypothetical protein [Bacteroidales bacterium]
MPSTETASAGDVLSLDDNKQPQWATPSGGGGVLVVNDVNGTLDKTWKEIHDAGFSVMVQTEGDEQYYYTLSDIHETGYMVVYFGGGTDYSYSAESANGYPTSGD